MKIINRIKAFFKRNEETVELDLYKAEIREGRAFLHTKGENPKSYMVMASDIQIWLNKDATIQNTDIMETKAKEPNEEKKLRQAIKETEAKKKQSAANASATDAAQTGTVIDFDRFKKRKFVISVYPEEYDILMSSIKEYGYKRADFVLACVSTATKGTMEKAHKKIVRVHREIVLEQQALAAKQTAELGERGEQTG